MPLAQLNDPVEVARASAALDLAWKRIQPGLPSGADADAARKRLAYIVAHLIVAANDETDLADRAVIRFMKGECADI